MGSMSAEILRNIVASTLKVNARNIILSGILPENFEVSEDNASGNLYSYSQSINVWAFSPKQGLIEVKGNDTYNSQNANGSWNNEYGVSFKDCASYKDALFFVVRNQKSGWQEGSEDWEEDTITLYKAPNFKEYFEKVEEKDIIRWKQWIEE